MTIQEKLANIQQHVINCMAEKDAPSFIIKNSNLQLNATAISTLKMIGGDNTLATEKNRVLILKGVDNSTSLVLTSEKELFGIKSIPIKNSGKSVFKKSPFLKVLKDSFPTDTEFILSDIVMNEALIIASINNTSNVETINIDIEDIDSNEHESISLSDTPDFIRTAEGIEELALEQEALEEIQLEYSFSMDELQKSN